MNQLNKIGPEHIERLGPAQLVWLLNILLHAEAKDRNVRKHGIHVPFAITVPDGGRDAKWDADIGPYEYIPRRLTYFQSKAQYLTEGDCRSEILRTDKQGECELKEKVQEVLEAGGAYVFFSSHENVKIDEKIKACHDALRDAGRQSPENDCIEFLDGSKIANWVNQHVAAFTFVAQQTTLFQGVGLRTITAWGQEATFEYQFQYNTYLADQIRSLREWLINPKRVARITGPSGLGKTRLGYETFACTDLGDNQIRKLLSDTAVYVDAQIYGDSVLGWVDQLSALGFSGTIVVDNCSSPWHYKLASVIDKAAGKLSLLTLDYVSESIRPGILHIELDPAKIRDIVPKILRSVTELGHLQDAEIERVAAFAQGFPQIAILTAKAGRALELRDLNTQNQLAEKLLWGRGSEDPKARDIIRCLSLFSYVGVSGNFKKQSEFIRQTLCGNLTEFDFNKTIRPFKDKRIIQEAGDYIMVTPAPLAVALAAEWLADASKDHILSLLPGIEDNGLTDQFCGRLHNLDFSEKAVELSRQLLGAASPLSSAEVLNSEVGSRVFRALAELNPLHATELLKRVFGAFTPLQCKEITTGRRNLIWALEKLCWPRETFASASAVLLLFAAGETETYANSATGQFSQLFHVLLSGTRCPPHDRLEVITNGLASVHHEVRNVCISALGSALEHNHFSRSEGPEVRGTQMLEKDWEPKVYTEIWAYWKEVFELLKIQILAAGETSEMAAHNLGSRIGAFLGNDLVFELENDFRLITNSKGGYWPEARDEIKDFLSFNTNVSPEAKEAIKRWLNCVHPNDLKSRFMDVVANPGWEHREIEGGGFLDISARNAQNFAEELYKNRINWEEHLGTLLQGEQRQAWSFGVACATLESDPNGLLQKCLSILKIAQKTSQNTQFVRGFLSALKDTNLVPQILDQVAVDEVLVEILVQLTTAIAPTLTDFDRVLKQITLNRLSPHAINLFAYGSVTIKFEDQAFRGRLESLLGAKTEAAAAILHVVNMHCHAQPAKLTVFFPLLNQIVVMPEILSQSNDSMTSHYWQENAMKLLSANPTDEWVAALTSGFIHLARAKILRPFGSVNRHKLIDALLSEHTRIAWPLFCEAFKTAQNSDNYLLTKLLTDGGSSFENHGSPLWALPGAELKIWAQSNPDSVPFILHFMALFIVRESKSGGEDYIWHPHALILLEFGELNKSVGCIRANLATFGSSGSRTPYLEKRVALIESLYAYAKPRFSNIADGIIGYFKESLEIAKKQDIQHAAGIY